MKRITRQLQEWEMNQNAFFASTSRGKGLKRTKVLKRYKSSEEEAASQLLIIKSGLNKL